MKGGKLAKFGQTDSSVHRHRARFKCQDHKLSDKVHLGLCVCVPKWKWLQKVVNKTTGKRYSRKRWSNLWNPSICSGVSRSKGKGGPLFLNGKLWRQLLMVINMNECQRLKRNHFRGRETICGIKSGHISMRCRNRLPRRQSEERHRPPCIVHPLSQRDKSIDVDSEHVWTLANQPAN